MTLAQSLSMFVCHKAFLYHWIRYIRNIARFSIESVLPTAVFSASHPETTMNTVRFILNENFPNCVMKCVEVIRFWSILGVFRPRNCSWYCIPDYRPFSPIFSLNLSNFAATLVKSTEHTQTMTLFWLYIGYQLVSQSTVIMRQLNDQLFSFNMD